MLTGWCPAPYENSIYTTTYFRSDQKKKNCQFVLFLSEISLALARLNFHYRLTMVTLFRGFTVKNRFSASERVQFCTFLRVQKINMHCKLFPSDRPRANNRSRLLRLLQVIIIIISEGHSYLTLTFVLGEMSLSNPFGIRILLFLSDSFGIETTNTFIHFRSFL